MGFKLPERTRVSRRRLRRPVLLAGFVVLALSLSGCATDNQWERFGMPQQASTTGQHVLSLWQGAWIAALATGVVTWALILGSAFWFRRRSDDEIPVQTRYNLPIEIFYTIFPIIMVVAFFAHTVRVQNFALEVSPHPDVTVNVVGQKWEWTFNQTVPSGPHQGKNVFVSGTGEDIPTLEIPVNKTVLFKLYSPDVIHDFGIPSFGMRMDVVPGEHNQYQITPIATGTYDGKCYELCGTYHSRMLFNVEVVTWDKYVADMAKLATNPAHVSDQPILGGSYASTPYLNGNNLEEGSE
ncbi:MAG TPA: cytochrome c oxidase subunit II [Nocardioides sp.]|nr:cytochrome c oxidase subunit II [Nocardioides sp.]